MMNASIRDAEKHQIRQYLLGQLTEADEEQVELRLLSDRAFTEEFDVVVDEIATNYVTGKFQGEEKTQVEQYFLRSPERREKVQFICEMVRQIGEGDRVGVLPPTLGQRVSSFWNQPGVFRPALTLASLLIVGGLAFWLISLNSHPTYQSFELAMASLQRSAGREIRKIRLEPGIDELRIKLTLPTPAGPQYSASLRGENHLNPLPLEIETRDANSITVKVSANQVTRGYYSIALTEINDGKETPLRDEYQFAIE